jgi:hypothetical protein
VVPSTFFPVLRAEQTTATLLFLRLALRTKLVYVYPRQRTCHCSPNDILGYVHGEPADAGAAKLLDNPSTRAVVLAEVVGGGGDDGGRTVVAIEGTRGTHLCAWDRVESSRSRARTRIRIRIRIRRRRRRRRRR